MVQSPLRMAFVAGKSVMDIFGSQVSASDLKTASVKSAIISVNVYSLP